MGREFYLIKIIKDMKEYGRIIKRMEKGILKSSNEDIYKDEFMNGAIDGFGK